jgi:hypothetical protein
MKPEPKTEKWYRVQMVNGDTAHLYSLEVTGRKIGKKRLLLESTPHIVFANWRALTQEMVW